MFTGIVRDQCPFRLYEKKNDVWSVSIETHLAEAEEWEEGASISVNGACLTITRKEKQKKGHLVFFDVSSETLEKTNLDDYMQEHCDRKVHVEAALKLSSSIGGHLVSGHVDSTGSLCHVKRSEDTLELSVELQGDAYHKISPYLVEKASVCVDGVSLTVNAVRDDHAASTSQFDLTLIPHTLELTHFLDLKVGDKVNVEADLLAKHVCRYNSFLRKV